MAKRKRLTTKRIIAGGLRDFFAENEIAASYIEVASPWQNGFAESFHARVRAEFVNLEWFYSYTEARVMAQQWQWKWNNLRPHGSLNYETPAAFAKQARDKAKEDRPKSASPRGGRTQRQPIPNHQETRITNGT